VNRREFITLLGGAAAWPRNVHAQRPTPVIGVLNGQSRAEVADYLAAFQQALSAAGYIEDRTVAIEYRWAEGHRDTSAALAADLVRHQVDVIFASGGTPMTLAAKAATATIPIVFAMGGDPVALGVVASLNRPGGNATGACYFYNTLGAKRLELMRALVPAATVIGYLINPTNPSIESESLDMHAAARALGLELRVQKGSNAREFEAAFAGFAEQRVDAVVAAADVQFTVQRAQVAALALRHRLPTSFHAREIVQAGGLMCYGPSQKDAYRQAGVYAGRILKGEKAADLPVQQATAFELVLNARTAKALGIEVPPILLALADQVIE
jgi:putative ABC transport system substrate-binding protein